MGIADILQITVYTVRLIIAVALATYAIKTKGTNFWWLFGLYFTSGVFGLTDFILQSGNIFALSSGFRFICMVLFIHYTFYLDRNNPTIYFFIMSVIFGTIIITFNILFDYIYPLELYDTIASITQIIGNLIVFSWLIYSSLNAFLNVKNDETIDDWVKMRYKLVIFYSFIGIFVAIAYGTITSTKINFYTISIFIATIVYQLVQLMAWVMPKFLRKFFNRHFILSTKIDELSEEEVISKMVGGN